MTIIGFGFIVQKKKTENIHRESFLSCAAHYSDWFFYNFTLLLINYDLCRFINCDCLSKKKSVLMTCSFSVSLFIHEVNFLAVLLTFSLRAGQKNIFFSLSIPFIFRISYMLTSFYLFFFTCQCLYEYMKKKTYGNYTFHIHTWWNIFHANWLIWYD